jgi:ketosteroid isomerase-like protein
VTAKGRKRHYDQSNAFEHHGPKLLGGRRIDGLLERPELGVKETVMKHRNSYVLPALAVAAFCLSSVTGSAASGDEAKIRALEAQFAAAFNAKDVDAIMKVYVPGKDLFVFDVTPPRQYIGADAYRKDWIELFAMFKGPVKFEVSDLAITAGSDIAFSRSIQHVSGTDTKGQPVDFTVRVTDDYRKISGRWLIVQEHISVPVDFSTGKPDLAAKP